MKSNHSFRSPLLLRALLILLLMVIPTQLLIAQLSLNTSRTTLGNVIKQIQSQSNYQFFYSDKLSTVPIEALKIQSLPLEEVLQQVLNGKNISFKVEDNIVYLNDDLHVSQNPQKQNADRERKISGQIVDENGEPLIGVNVLVKGTTNGIITDFDGNYTLIVAEENPVLLFSYIGYTPQEIPVKGQNVINLTMAPDTQIIDEVVVTALGIKREKKMLGYAVQDLKGDKLNQTGDPSVTSALQGKVAGLQMNTASTGLGGSTKITLRGNSSLTDNNQPLWVIDGVPFSDESSSSVSLFGGTDRGGSAVDINPEDIESISVLKGPNAAALYGSRAGNGVILITTKKGTRKDGFGITYSGNLTWSQVAETINMQSQYGQGEGGVYNPKSMYSFGPELDGSEQEAWNGQTMPYQKYGDKMKDYFSTGFSQNHNVSIGSVKEGAHYRMSLGSTETDGLFQKEHLSKVNLDVKAGIDINKYLSTDAKLSLSRTKMSGRPWIGKTGEVYQLLAVPNNVRLEDLQQFSDENSRHLNWYGPSPEILNPYYLSWRRDNMDDRWRAFGYYNVKLNFTPWLYGTAKYAFDFYRTKLQDSDKTDGIDPITKAGFNRSENNFYESNFEAMVVGNNNIGQKIRIGYSLGVNAMHQKSEGLTGMANNMLNFGEWVLNSAKGWNASSQAYREKKVNSAFGTFQFAWDEYLALDLTARNDWSSTLPIDNCSYFYPSANLSFVVSDFMDKMQWNRPSWLTFAKVRLSAAQVGKDTEPYILTNVVKWEQTESGVSPIQPTVLANANLKPEISTAYEAGLDMKFFSNRLGFDMTYYYSRTKNQIMKVPMGGLWSHEWINAGLIVNKGIEVSIYSTPIQTKDFTFNLDVNLAHNESIVKELAPNAKNMIFNSETDGLMVNVGAVEGGKLGDIYPIQMFERLPDGSVVVDDTGLPKVVTGSNTTPIGNIQPNLLMSIAPSFQYKGFVLSALFDMKFGGDIISVSEAVATSYGTAERTSYRGSYVYPGSMSNPDFNPFQPVSSENPQFVQNTKEITCDKNYYTRISGAAEAFIYDASFIKLKEISLGYNFPKALLSKTPLSSLRLSLVGRNLCYLLKHTPGTSPEGGFDTSMFSQALDFSAVPYTRTFGFSVNVSF
jgi:TonB-linked SusC/RagA family outer membrane protein